MTKQEAIENHRKMWNWIADETIKQGRIVEESEYFHTFYTPEKIMKFTPRFSFCCEYDETHTKDSFLSCAYCPILFVRSTIIKISNPCTSGMDESPYFKWLGIDDDKDYKEAAKYAREIAELPERRFEDD